MSFPEEVTHALLLRPPRQSTFHIIPQSIIALQRICSVPSVQFFALGFFFLIKKARWCLVQIILPAYFFLLSFALTP